VSYHWRGFNENYNFVVESISIKIHIKKFQTHLFLNKMIAPRQHKSLILEHMVGPREQPCPQGEKVLSGFKEQPFPSGRKSVMLFQEVTMFLGEQMCLKCSMIVTFSYELIEVLLIAKL